MSELNGLRVAVLAADGVEDPELTEPVKALKDAGAGVTIISPAPGEIQAVGPDINPTIKIRIDRAIKDVNVADFDAVQLPGGAV
jgi:deglycase